MLQFRNVSLSFDDHQVLYNISFSAGFNEKIAIIGPSGEGKTTILKLLVGLIVPQQGEILIDGRDITRLSESQLSGVRRNFSIVFQEGALFDSMSVRENVAFCLRECGDHSEEEIQEKVTELLRRVDIEKASDLMPEELSGGMQRRTAIARSLAAGEPKMMLYDEPTTGLDPVMADNICDLINELSSGEPSERHGVVIVTHDVENAAKVAERFLYLKEGRIMFDGSLADLKETRDPDLRKFIRAILN
jgi:phospholipid/cholesterol/gamma-HCH transport system ATP-binding protein